MAYLQSSEKTSFVIENDWLFSEYNAYK